MTFSKTKYTSQYMDNWSFDDTYKQNAVENLVYNPITSDLDRMVQPLTSTSTIPLPTGAATSALQTTLNALITTLNSTVATNDKTHLLLQQIRDSISMRPDYVEASNSQNVAVVGSVGTTVASGTITQVTTVLGQTNIGGFSADMMVENSSFQDWGLSIRSLLI